MYFRLRYYFTVYSCHNFEVVDKCIYPGININKTLLVFEIQCRITLASRCYLELSRKLKSEVLSRRTKSKLCKSLLPYFLWCRSVDDVDIRWDGTESFLEKLFFRRFMVFWTMALANTADDRTISYLRMKEPQFWKFSI